MRFWFCCCFGFLLLLLLLLENEIASDEEYKAMVGISPDRKERETGGLWDTGNSPGEKKNRHILPAAITNVALTLPKQ